MSATFLLSQASRADLLGLWRDEAATAAFGAADATVDIQLWRADLPGDPVQAADRLRAAGGRLRRFREQLMLADDRLRTTVDDEVLPYAEPTAGWWQDASRQVASIAGTVARALSPTMLVETRAGAELIGRSLVRLRGDLRTVWRPEVGEAGGCLHEATVALALSSRATVLRMIAVVTRGATALAVRLALPGGPLLALPTAWRFVQRVSSEPGEYYGEG